MDTNAIRRGFGSAAGRAAQISAYHKHLVQAANEIDRLRAALDGRLEHPVEVFRHKETGEVRHMLTEQHDESEWEDAFIYTNLAIPQIVAVPEGWEWPSVIREKLQRFKECSDDNEGVDIGREWLDALTTIGLLKRAQRSPAMWKMRDAAIAMLSAAHVPPSQETKDAEIEALRSKLADAEEAAEFNFRQYQDLGMEIDKEAKDAERYLFLADYLVGTRCDLDDEIVACSTVGEISEVIDAAMSSQKGGAA